MFTGSSIAFASFDLNSSVSTDCFSFGINDDTIIESVEYLTIILVQRNREVEFVDNTTTVVIMDDDSKTCIDLDSQFGILQYLSYKLVVQHRSIRNRPSSCNCPSICNCMLSFN